MSFTKFVEREVKITQMQMLGNLFPDELPEVKPEPTNLIILPNVGVISPNSTYMVYNNTNSAYGTAARIYNVTTATTSTIPTIWTNLSTSSTSTSTCNNIITCTDNLNNTIYYRGNTSTTFYTNGNAACYTPRSKSSKVKKTVKNSIKRALKLLDNFGMDDVTKIFLNGDEVEVSHPDSLFKFVITKRKYNSIILSTTRPSRSIPFSLELFTKTGIHLANLCVYAEGTPMLDTLFMIAMYVKSGNEEDLLRKANFSSICNDVDIKNQIVSEVDYLKPKLIRKY